MYRDLAAQAPRRLEVGPGCHPKLPIAGTHVVDLSQAALDMLAQRGAIVHRGPLQEIGFPDASFDLIGIFEVLEHVDADAQMLAELARLLRPGGLLCLDVPLHMRYYSAFDRLVGHVRRYAPEELRQKIEAAGFEVVRFEGRMLMGGRFVMFLLALFVRAFPRLSLRMVERNGPTARHKLGLKWQETDFEGCAQAASDISVICRKRDGRGG